MQFSIITAILAGATMVAALPADMSPRQSVVCPGTDSTPQCCAVNVLDLADLNCANPPETPTSLSQFTSMCAAIGQQAQCCLLPILEQALVCSAAV